MDPSQVRQGGPVIQTAADKALFSKVNWHLLPLLIVCYIISFIDRINIGFAQLQMKQTLTFSDEAYAFGAGIFFLGYFLFEVPSNLMLEKIGARKTLLRIMFCWGIVASAMMYVQTPTQFYVLRFLLGAFEAGFFPGIILYLTFWYPSARRGQVIAIFMTGTAIAYLLAGPTSGAIMKYMDGFLNHHGWQWLFVVQGLPASFLGIVAFFYLKDRPEDASWLSASEKTALRGHLDNDKQCVEGASHGSLGALLRDPKIYVLSFIYCVFLGASYAMLFWVPTLIKSWGVVDVFWIGMASALPALFGIVGMVLIGRSSDAHRERRWHFMLSTSLAAAGVLMTILTQGNLVGSLAGLCLMSIGQSAMTPIFFAAVSEYVPRKTAAGGIALISSLGNLGPFVTPSLVASINSATGTQVTSLAVVMTLWIAAGAILTFVLRPAPTPQLALA